MKFVTEPTTPSADRATGRAEARRLRLSRIAGRLPHRRTRPGAAARAAPVRGATLGQAPRTATVRDDAAAYFGGDGPHAVLLCHGFTGTPRSMRGWAEHLESEGFRVSLPRLPGHGTTWQELNTTEWTDWYAVVEREFTRLRDSCDKVFVTGLSMGGCLALRLAEQFGDDVAGIAVVNPAVMSADRRLQALPVLRRLMPSLDGIASDIAMPQVTEGGYDRTPLHALASMMQMWRDVSANLGRIDQPLVIYRSRVDHVVDPGSAQAILAAVSSTDVSEVVLERSYHVATMDYDAEEIFTGSSAFFRRLATA